MSRRLYVWRCHACGAHGHELSPPDAYQAGVDHWLDEHYEPPEAAS